MQHIQLPALQFEGHATAWQTIKYLSLALAGLIAVFEHSPGLLVLLALAFVIFTALTKRIRKLQSVSSVNPQDAASRLLGDGGSFPGVEPEKEQQEAGTPCVLDGGSL
jgi:hypothetical protein